MTKKLLIVLGSVTAMALPYAAAAQSNTAAPSAAPAMQQPTANAEVSDTQLKEFVKVEQKVRAVSADYQQKLASAEDETQMNAIAQEANAEMTGIVNESPLSVDEYNQIAMLISSNPDLQQKYQQHNGAGN